MGSNPYTQKLAEENEEKLLKVYNDKSLWRPPSLRTLKEKGGWKSDNSVLKVLKRLKDKKLI